MNAADAIYWIAVQADEEYPRIDFSHPKNRGIDWLSIAQMIDGELPLDGDRLLRAVVTIKKKRGQERLGVDALWFEHRILVSPQAKAAIDELNLNGISFLAMSVNTERFFALKVIRTIDCLDKDQSELEYFASNPTRVMMIRKHVFQKALVPDPCIFQLPENRARIFATPTVKATLEQARVCGMQFIDLEKVAPVDSGETTGA